MRHLKEIFSAPLIIGASQSNDQNSPSPGRKLAMRLNPAAEIQIVAKGGTTGLELLQNFGERELLGRTCVLALDTFFWDSFLANPEASLLTLDRFIGIIRKANLPLALGDIPEIMRGWQPSRSRLNQAIQQAGELPRVARMPFESLHLKLLSEGHLFIEGKRRAMNEIVPDGLHLADFASDYLADILHEKVEKFWE